MYLSELIGALQGYVEEDECVDIFHQRKTIRLLRALYREMGPETYRWASQTA
jgi:hypothetical protein